jgi:hypothetical protein
MITLPSRDYATYDVDAFLTEEFSQSYIRSFVFPSQAVTEYGESYSTGNLSSSYYSFSSSYAYVVGGVSYNGNASRFTSSTLTASASGSGSVSYSARTGVRNIVEYGTTITTVQRYVALADSSVVTPDETYTYTEPRTFWTSSLVASETIPTTSSSTITKLGLAEGTITSMTELSASSTSLGNETITFAINSFSGTSFYAGRNERLFSFSTDEWVPISDCNTATSFYLEPQVVYLPRPFQPSSGTTSGSTYYFSMLSTSAFQVNEFVLQDRLPWQTVSPIQGSYAVTHYTGASLQTTTVIGLYQYNSYSTYSITTLTFTSGRGGGTTQQTLYSFRNPGNFQIYNPEYNQYSSKDGELILLNGFAEFITTPVPTSPSAVTSGQTITSGGAFYSAAAIVTIPDWDHPYIAGRFLKTPAPFQTSTVVTKATTSSSGWPHVRWTELTATQDHSTVSLSFDTAGNCYSSITFYSYDNGSYVVSSTTGSMSFITYGSRQTYAEWNFANELGLRYCGGNPSVHDSASWIFGEVCAIQGTSGDASSTSTYTYMHLSSETFSFTTQMQGSVSVFQVIPVVKGRGVVAIPYNTTTSRYF